MTLNVFELNSKPSMKLSKYSRNDDLLNSLSNGKHLKKISTVITNNIPMPTTINTPEHIINLLGRTKKWTGAGNKLKLETGLVFRTHLQDKEYVYLNAAEFGEVDVIKDLLEDPNLDVNCVDYMGRNALLLAIKNENFDLVNLLLSKLDFYAIEDALLHAISLEKNHLVKLIVDHPQYILLEKQVGQNNFSRYYLSRSKRSQFSSDISPLMLAAHVNNHEIIQLLLDRGLELEMPHDRGCFCLECETIRGEVNFFFYVCFLINLIYSILTSKIILIYFLHYYY